MRRGFALLSGILIVGAARDARAEEEDLGGRAEWWQDQRSEPDVAIPDGAMARAVRTWTAPAASGITWNLVGPAALDTTAVKPNMSNASGRVTALVAHPSDPKILYQGTALGGVWKTVDGGATWKPMGDDQPSLSIGALAVDPTAPETLYVGTGEATSSGDSYAGRGLLKSTNGGTTFTPIGTTTFAGLSVSKIVVRGSALYVSAAYGVAGSNATCGTTDNSARWGLYRSTDGGTSFTQLFAGDEVVDFELDPGASPARALISRPEHGIDVLDLATKTTTRVTSLPQDEVVTRIELARAPSNPSVLYAGVGLTEGKNALYRSTDGGAAWTLIPDSPNYCTDQCDYDNVVEVHPTDPSIVYFGGSKCAVWKMTGGMGAAPVFRAVSTTTGTCGADWTNDRVHSDLHAIVFHPTDPSTLYVGSDGGVAVTRNAGATFSRINADVATLQLYKVCAEQTNVTALGGAMQDNGIATHAAGDASRVWQQQSTGDGTGCVMNLLDPNPSRRFLLGAVQNGTVYWAPDLVSAWTTVFDPTSDDLPGHGERVLFVPPLTTRPGDPTDVLIGTHRVWRSRFGGKKGTWNAISGDVTLGEDVPRPCDGKKRDDMLSAIAVAPGDANRIYTGSRLGVIQTTANGGMTWTNVTKAPLPGRHVGAIAVDANDPKIVTVAYSGFSSATPTLRGHVFRSHDAGATWARADSSIDGFDVPFSDVVVHPGSSKILYAATDQDVLVTADEGASWSSLAHGLPNVPVVSLLFHAASKTIVAGTHGRSTWTAKLEARAATSPPSLRFEQVVGGPAPAAQTLTVLDANAVGAALPFTVSPATAAPWLHTTPSSGTLLGKETAPITVSVTTAGLAVGSHQSTVRIVHDGKNLDVPVTIDVVTMPPPALTPEVARTDEGPAESSDESCTAAAVGRPGGGWLELGGVALALAALVLRPRPRATRDRRSRR